MDKKSGVIVRDAVVREVSGSKVVDYTLVENTSYKTKTGEIKEEAVYYECSDWHREKLAPYLVKGAVVAVEGKIGARAYINKSNEAVGVLTLKVREIRLLYTPKSKDKIEPEAQDALASDDLPF